MSSIDGPAYYMLETRYGKLRVHPQDATRICADATEPGHEQDPDREPLVIHGVAYRLYIYLRRSADGWIIDKTSGLPGIHGMRINWTSYNQSHLSNAAYAKVHDEIVPLLIAWAESHPDELRDAELAMLRGRVAEHGREIKKLSDEIGEHQAAIEADLAQIKLIDGS